MFYFAKFHRRNFVYGALWLVSWPVFTNIEQSIVDVGFRKFISSVKVLTFKRKISKFLFENGISKLIANVKGAWQWVSITYFTEVEFGWVVNLKPLDDRPILEWPGDPVTFDLDLTQRLWLHHQLYEPCQIHKIVTI